MDKPKKSHALRSVVSFSIISVLLGAGYFQRFWIYDQIRLWDYNPPAAVIKLADEAVMTSDTRRMFYANRPQLEDKTSFANHCSVAEQTIVLGCYVSRQGIYLYSVSDERLNGVMQVTAAHETLHAAYERLGGSQKRTLNQQLQAAFDNLGDERIKKTIQSYRDAGADIPNELHSILGTEVRALPKELEDHYAKYFSNRETIVNLSERYQAEFTGRQAKVDAADEQLKKLKPEIDTMLAKIDTDASSLNQQYQQLNSLKKAGKIEQYNAGVAPYNAAVASYNQSVKKTQALIDTYNSLVKERNEIALEENELGKAIDSRPSQLDAQ